MPFDSTGADSANESQVLYPGDAESLLYYAFDAVTLDPVRIPVGARAVVIQILVPVAQTSFCFDYFALRLCKYLPFKLDDILSLIARRKLNDNIQLTAGSLA